MFLLNMVKSFFGLTFLRTRNYEALQGRVNDLEVNLNQMRDSTTYLQSQLSEEEQRRLKAEDAERDALEIAQTYLLEKQRASLETNELRRALENTAKSESDGFSNDELNILRKYIIPQASITLPKDKIKTGGYHDCPRGTNKFLERVAKCPYVSHVKRVRTTANGVKLTHMRKVGNNDDNGSTNNLGYKIAAVYVNDTGVEVEITTTATSDVQLEFVYRLLRKELRLKD